MTVGILPATAQSLGEEDFKRELSYGINFNSNGGLIGGAFIRSSHFMKKRMYQFGALEIVEVKHPKEYPVYNYETGDRFIFQKQNYLFVVRPQYGREYVLFRKAPESGVQVNAIAAAGPSLGLLVPYYIQYRYPGSGTNPQMMDIRTEQYDKEKHSDPYNIMGSANVFTGLGEAKINVGLHAKAGVSFEYGRYEESIAGIEVGFMYEQYANKLNMIVDAEKYSQFLSVYLNLYYGSRR
ncbi:hypothetical protein [Pontibacter sp. SGAir0037]|uniref:hypothetical protein n=1 Tax=Pontibacter sp. SGAir0037 TaxID=2571030 RepID=UPI0010CCE086|nr:hypothetical protein [Pontibacter sp. SGAir0037]QCR23861.1 hypothetical protein C1N53_16920 [Pontibacter sp. SGAir0037]